MPLRKFARCTSNFLNIIRQSASRCIVINVKNIRYIDTHPKRLRSKHDNGFSTKERFVCCLLFLALHTTIVSGGMLRRKLISYSQFLVNFIDLTSIREIDNSFFAARHEVCNSFCDNIGFGFAIGVLWQAVYRKIDIVAYNIA